MENRYARTTKESSGTCSALSFCTQLCKPTDHGTPKDSVTCWTLSRKLWFQPTFTKSFQHDSQKLPNRSHFDMFFGNIPCTLCSQNPGGVQKPPRHPPDPQNDQKRSSENSKLIQKCQKPEQGIGRKYTVIFFLKGIRYFFHIKNCDFSLFPLSHSLFLIHCNSKKEN